MLETNQTAAEYIVRSLKKNKNKIDYVHPENKIENGYIIVNYRKREMEKRVLMDGRMQMTIPKDWYLKEQKRSGKFLYGSPYEKEILLCEVREGEKYKTIEREVTEILQREHFTILEEKTLFNKQQHPFRCISLTDCKERYMVLFECSIFSKVIKGVFMMHYFRKKVWEKVIEQMLEHAKIEEVND